MATTDLVSPGIPPAPADRFLTLAEVLAHVGIGRTAWTDRVREGSAPKPIRVGARSLWVASEINQWMAAQIAASRQQVAA